MIDQQWIEMKDELLQELVNIREEVAELREQLRKTFDEPLRVRDINQRTF